ncbi:MAG: ATP-binding protein [Acidobacteria bacterium]|nr:ATP-binding protein [Acidobacteriota bacterium]
MRDVSWHDADQLEQARQRALFGIAALINQNLELSTFYQAIHSLVGELLPAKNLYIAIREPQSDIIHFPYFVDEYDPYPDSRQLETVQDVESGRVTDYVFRTGQPKLMLKEDQLRLGFDKREIDAGSLSEAWLGVPLKNNQGETFGVLAVQSYNRSWVYGEKEKDLLIYVSHHISAVLQIKWKTVALEQANRELTALNDLLETRVAERTQTLSDVNRRLEEKNNLLQQTQMELMEQAHAAGMADIASSLVHNIGNALNQAFVSLNQLAEKPFQRWVESMDKLSQCLALIQQDPSKAPKAQEYLDKIRQSLSNANDAYSAEIKSLQGSLLQVQSLSESQYPLTQSKTFLAWVNWPDFIAKILANFSSRIELGAVSVRIHLPPPTQVLLPIYTLKRALSYLIDNSLDAKQTKGTLTLSVSSEADQHRISIEDDGCGIAPEHIPCVFQLGFSTKDRHGFGLHYASNAIKAVGGTIELHSQLGFGTNVTILLPHYSDHQP